MCARTTGRVRRKEREGGADLFGLRWEGVAEAESETESETLKTTYLYVKTAIGLRWAFWATALTEAGLIGRPPR